MDPSHSINIEASAGNEIVHSESSLAQEDTATGKNGDECLSMINPDVSNAAKQGMDLKVFEAAKGGEIDALQKHTDNLHQMLTPTKNTVLHIYIACATFSTPQQVQNAVDIVEKMIALCRPLLLQPNESGDTPLHIAARYGLADIAKHLILQAGNYYRGDLDENGLEKWRKLIRTTNEEGDTALHQAVRFNHLGVVKILTTVDPKFSYEVNGAGETPLYLAVERGYTDLVIQILDTCTSPAYQGPNGRTALHAAVRYKDAKMTTNLLAKIKDLTAVKDEQGCTPLHLAASFGHTSIVKELLKHDRAAAYVGDNDQKTALHFAASKGHDVVMKELITQCPDCCELVDHKRRNALHCAIDARRCDFQVGNLVLRDPWLSHVLLNGKDDKGDTPLHRLAACDSIYTSPKLGTDARVDKMAFNKENRNAFDILLQDNSQFYSSSTQGVLKDNLKMNGVIPGCRIVSNKDVKDTEGDEYDKVKDSHLVVATLIATVSFAAGFTMPGGYQSDKGPDQGFTVLIRNAAFQTFVITNTIAMTLSSCSVLFSIYSAAFYKRKVLNEAFLCLYMLTMLALIAMVISFITGTYAVLGHSSRLAIVVCVLSCVLFFVLAEFLIYDEGDTLEGPQLVPLGVSIWLLWLMMRKMKHTMRKLHC